MKTMREVQEKILSKARWDGGWPRAVHMGMGIIALAKDESDLKSLRRQRNLSYLAGAILGVVLTVAGLMIYS
jgi:hypothetical protein